MLTLEGCRARQDRLLAAMRERGWQWFVTGNYRSVYYFSGALTGPDTPAYFALDAEGASIVVTAPAAAAAANEVAANEVARLETYSIHRSISDPAGDPARLLHSALAKRGGRVSFCGVECCGVESCGEAIRECWPQAELANATPAVLRLRKRKEEDEIAEIRAALRLSHAAYDAARATIRPGLTEMDVFNAMQAAVNRDAGTPVPLIGEFACGERAGVSGRTTAQGYLSASSYTPGTNILFTGQYRDPELASSIMPSGLDYFGARHHAPAFGRFMQPDPVGNIVADAGSPQSWHLYNYVANNPLAYIDPTGLDPCPPGSTADTCVTVTDTTDPVDYSWSWLWNSLGAYFSTTVYAAPPPPSKPPARPNTPPKTGTCPAGASAAGLTYPPGVQQHIEQLHMIFLPNGQGNNFTYYKRGGVDIPRSQYYFDPSGTAAQNWNLVTQINAQTFSLATPQPSRGNVLFTATLGPQNNPVPGARPYLGIDYSGSFNLFGFKVPVMKSYTSTNTLVTRSDCQTVVSSYPGNP